MGKYSCPWAAAAIASRHKPYAARGNTHRSSIVALRLRRNGFVRPLSFCVVRDSWLVIRGSWFVVRDLPHGALRILPTAY